MPDAYHAAATAAALFDTSAAGKVTLAGPDARSFVHAISTNDVKSLQPGGGCDLFFCDARAKALFRASAYYGPLPDGEPGLWLDTAPGRGAALHKHLDRFLISEAVELADLSADFAQLHLAGPTAKEVLETAGGPVPNLIAFQHVAATIGCAPCHVHRRDPLGLPGYDIVCRPDQIEAVRAALVAVGATVAGPEVYEVLRIEAGTPLDGVDFDDTRFVMEVGGAAGAVSYAKGCFPGQEPIVMARDRAGRINRQFLGLKVLAGGAVSPGTKLTRDGKDVGVVTSVTESPRLGGPLALGYVHWQSADAGTRLEAGGSAVVVIGYPPFGVRG